VDDIRAALLDHVNERSPAPDFRSAAGFTFELCDKATRSQALQPPDPGTPPHRPRAFAVAIGFRLGSIGRQGLKSAAAVRFTLMAKFSSTKKTTILPCVRCARAFRRSISFTMF
jgi:hypothetical protein